MRYVLICVSLCIASMVLAQSPIQGQLTGKSSKKAADDQRGTAKSPVFVQPLAAVKTEEERQREEADRKQKSDLEIGTYRVNRLQLFFNALLVVTTIVMGFITYKAARAAERSAIAAQDTVERMKDTAVRQLRAYISVETYAPTDIDGGRMEGKYALLIKNRGQTPAHKVRSWMAYEAREFPLKGPLERRASSGSVAILSPGEEQILINDWPQIPEAHVAAVRAGTKAAYIFGEVLYEDAFGNDRYTRFRLFQSGKGVGHQRLANYPEGNEAT